MIKIANFSQFRILIMHIFFQNFLSKKSLVSFTFTIFYNKNLIEKYYKKYSKFISK